LSGIVAWDVFLSHVLSHFIIQLSFGVIDMASALCYIQSFECTDRGADLTESRRWGRAANLLRLLGHPVRLALLEELSRAPKCVTDIQDLLEVRQANVSQHLAVLREAEIVACHEDGNLRCYYVLRPGLVRDLLQLLGRDHPCKPRNATQVRRAAGTQRKQCAIQTTVAKGLRGNKFT
jgi:ArsR family transcriptional regulator, arsenate/arsenite/antimonite-responsive transcriptional repressor